MTSLRERMIKRLGEKPPETAPAIVKRGVTVKTFPRTAGSKLTIRYERKNGITLTTLIPVRI